MFSLFSCSIVLDSLYVLNCLVSNLESLFIKAIVVPRDIIIAFLKAMFCRHGIPMTLMSDNGPQFGSKEFQDFSSAYHFSHITSSPQSNVLAERAVRTVKKLLQGSKDPFLAL